MGIFNDPREQDDEYWKESEDDEFYPEDDEDQDEENINQNHD